MNLYTLCSTIWGLDEKLAPYQINCLNNYCYEIRKFNHCNYFLIVNQGIQKLENLSNSQARSSARERCCYWYRAAWGTQVTARQTHVRRAQSNPSHLEYLNAKEVSNPAHSQKEKRSLTKFICNFSKISCKLNCKWFGDKGVLWLSCSPIYLLGCLLPDGAHARRKINQGEFWVVLLLMIPNFMFYRILPFFV